MGWNIQIHKDLGYILNHKFHIFLFEAFPDVYMDRWHFITIFYFINIILSLDIIINSRGGVWLEENICHKTGLLTGSRGDDTRELLDHLLKTIIPRIQLLSSDIVMVLNHLWVGSVMYTEEGES